MRSLLKNDLESFLKRFGNFIDAEFRSIEIITPTNIKITLAAQDGARGFDWISLGLVFSGVSDAKLLESSKLTHTDMSEGITLLFADNSFALALGIYKSLSAAANSACYIKASSLKYAEGSF
ncbi:MAG: hypothetical protein WC390_05425 [Sulfurimonas sp.]|jgi:hypothetical protein